MGRKTFPRFCVNCSNEFQARTWDIENGGGLFCSRRCSGSAGGRARSRTDQSGSNNPNYKGERKLTNYQYKLRSEAKHPEAAKSRKLFQDAVRRGHIVRLPCQKCGEIKSHGHHEDYSKPFNVIWLCKKHHNEAHGF